MLVIKIKRTVVYKGTNENTPLPVPLPRESHDDLFALYLPSTFSVSVHVFLCVLQNEIILYIQQVL